VYVKSQLHLGEAFTSVYTSRQLIQSLKDWYYRTGTYYRLRRARAYSGESRKMRSWKRGEGKPSLLIRQSHRFNLHGKDVMDKVH